MNSSFLINGVSANPTEASSTAAGPPTDVEVLQQVIKDLAAKRNVAMGLQHAAKMQLAALRKRQEEIPTPDGEKQIQELQARFLKAEAEANGLISEYTANARALEELTKPPTPTATIPAASQLGAPVPPPRVVPAPEPPTILDDEAEKALLSIDPEDSKTLGEKAQEIFIRLFGKKGRTRTGPEQTAYVIIEKAGGLSERTLRTIIPKLVGVESRMQRKYKAMATHNAEFAKREWLENSRRIADAVVEGTNNKLDAWSRADHESDASETQQIIKDSLCRDTQGYWPLSTKVGREAIEILQERKASLEQSDRERHEDLGVPWPGPNSISEAIQRAITMIEQRTQQPPYGWVFPSVALPFVNF